MQHAPRKIALLFITCATIFSSGCSLVAPKYTASFTNLQELKKAGDIQPKVGPFTGEIANKSINLRGSSLSSPYSGSYANYLSEALVQELTLAGKLKPNSNIEISGKLLQNNLLTGVTGMGQGVIQAQFVVKKDGVVKYDQVKTANTEWPTSFVGAVAIPRAQQEYPNLVQALLLQLYRDKSFLDALK
jgi:hypothetical protein